MTSVNPYLTFNGNCEEAFNFYRSVFGGEFQMLGRFAEMPPSDEYEISEEDAQKVMHVSLPISTESTLMGSDTVGEWGKDFAQGNNFSISIGTDGKEEADRLFGGLSEGGEARMPMNQTFWGSYFGMLTDKFGINWMVSFGTGHDE